MYKQYIHIQRLSDSSVDAMISLPSASGQLPAGLVMVQSLPAGLGIPVEAVS